MYIYIYYIYIYMYIYIYIYILYIYIYIHEQQAPLKRCLSSRHSTACGDYKRNIYENTSSVRKTSKC